MMRPLLLVLAISSGCATTEAVPPARQMPSASANLGGGPPALQPSCMTRYDFPDLNRHFSCQTAFIGGDPHHYVTTCPDAEPLLVHHGFPGPESYMFPVTTDEIVLDAAGNLSHQVRTQVKPEETIVTVTDWFYDAQGRFAERKMTDGTGRITFDSVIGERDAQGRPLTESATGDPIEIYVKYPGTVHRTGEFRYGDDERLVAVQFRFQPSGALYFDRTIAYDDVEHRRSYFTTIDVSVDVPIIPGVSHSTSFDIVDDDGRIIEAENVASDSDPTWRLDLRYDDQDRLTTAISTYGGQAATASYIYDCP